MSDLLGRMKQGDLEPSSLMLASYWSSKFEETEERDKKNGRDTKEIFPYH